MRWIKITSEADLPKEDGFYIVKTKQGFWNAHKQQRYVGLDNYWLTEIDCWLDETEERMFTIEEMRKAFFDGEYNGAIGEFGGVPIHETDYFKETFNIDL